MWFEMDPLGDHLNDITAYVFKHHINFMLSASVRLAAYLFIAMELVKSVSGTLVLSLIVLQGSTRRTTRIMEALQKFGDSKTAGIQIHKELRIWNRFYNLYYVYYVCPPLIWFGVSILVLTNYGTIKLFGKVHILVYVAFPIISAIASTFLVTVLPQAAEVYEVSSTYLNQLRGSCFTKYERKLFRSLKPIGIRCASFGMVTTDWMVAIIQSMVDNTINLLLTF